MVRQIVRLRWRHRLGPVQIDGQLGRPCLDRARCAVALSDQPAVPHRLGDWRTTATLRTLHPGSLIHVDVTQFGNIPYGGGHRFVGRQQGGRNR
jgi:hypothetical protein